MIRIVRILAAAVAVFLLAWMIKEVLGGDDARKAENLVQRIRMNGA